ncbi:RNA polymerase sigma factor [Micromonospora krabiensis]|uniref:Sigma-70, region 4 n=1 Tax=Micromonospora krabiensis TaxID=307121 RepID=A0A1C3N5U8_9ACTN|nr:hypothetical protein [Micromonospora krabiensis]SBV27962.1 hypothetical protein GA0070620_3493 [Micromonospora krabiensis]
MSVGAPGSYRSLDWRGRYSPELVAVMLPVAWGHAPWVTREPRVDRCRRGAGTCGHTCQDDQWDEGCTVDGEHKVCEHRHGGHDQCGRCACVDPTSRQATNTRDPDAQAMAVDMARAWAALYALSFDVIAEALSLHHHHGLTQDEIARIQGVSRQAVSLRLRAGHLAIADFLNGESA